MRFSTASIILTLLSTSFAVGCGDDGGAVTPGGQSGAAGQAGAARASGSSGQGGGSGNPGSSIAPVQDATGYAFTGPSLSFHVALNGGRVDSLVSAGTALLTDSTVNATNFGSTHWVSPQDLWGWPPPAAWDSEPYTASVEGDAVVLSGAADPKLSIAFEKTFSMQGDVISVDLVMNNLAATAQSAAPWQISRVPGSSTCFFPSTNTRGASTTVSGTPLVQDGVVWVDAAAIGDGKKLFIDGEEGWIGCVVGTRLFLISYPDIAISEAAAGEAEIEFYLASASTYMEVEPQGAFAELSATPWTVKWTAVEIPSGTDTAAGSAALITLARASKP